MAPHRIGQPDQSKQADRPLIGDRNDAALVEHAQAMFQRGHRHVEFSSEAGGFHPPVHGAEQDGADVGGQLAEAGEHEKEQDGQHRVVAIAAQQQPH
ncbi:hypothetical protein D9M68_988390 [compost metagenome]